MWNCYLQLTHKVMEAGASQLLSEQAGIQTQACRCPFSPRSGLPGSPYTRGSGMGTVSRMTGGFVGQLCHQPSVFIGWDAEGPESPSLTHYANHLAFSFRHLPSFESAAEPLLDLSLTQMNWVAICPIK